MGPLSIIISMVLLSFVMPLFWVWPAVSFGLLHVLATVVEPKACQCPPEAQARSAQRSRDVIVMFVRQARYGEMMGALHHLHMNFNNCFRKRVLLFHNDIISSRVQDLVRKMHPQVRFHFLRSGSAHWQSTPPGVVRKPGGPAGSYAVTRWHSMLVFDYLRERGFEWFMRLDDNARIVSCIEYDPFAFLEAGNRSHGYRFDELSQPAAAHALPELVQKHVARRGLTPPSRLLARFKDGALHNSTWDRRVYGTSWMLTRLSFWSTSQVRAWQEEVDSSAVAYHHHVGDATIQTMTQLLFMGEDEVYRFSDWSYMNDHLAAVAPRTVLPSVLSSLLPSGCEWAGGVRDPAGMPRYRAEFNWMFRFLLGPLMRREFWFFR